MLASTWNSRTWPADLEALLKNGQAIEMAPSTYSRICPNCGGVGAVMVYKLASGPTASPQGRCKWLDAPKPGWYQGEMISHPCPVCQGDQLAAYLLQNCGLQGEDLKVNLSSFRVDGDCAGKKIARDFVAQQLLARRTCPAGFVTFVGGNGVGKSHLLKSLVNGYVEAGVAARYTTVADLLNGIKNKFGDGLGATEAMVADLRRVRVLCVDEVEADKFNASPWARETIFRIMDARFNEHGEQLTALATNHLPEDFPPELSYLASRMRGGIVIQIPGPDMRASQGYKNRSML